MTMAASTQDSKAFNATPVREHNRVIELVSLAESFIVDELNDIVRFHKLPLPVAVPLYARLICGDFDGAAGATFNVQLTNGTTTYDIITNATTPQAGGSTSTEGSFGTNHSQWYGKPLRGTNAAPWYFQVKMTTVGATPVLTAQNIQLGVRYHCDIPDGG
jgi:hypothetical protein